MTPTLGPQHGPQVEYLQTSADIAIFGGGAGGGKSFALLMDAARYERVPGYSAIIFRRTHPQIVNPGGLWDTSCELMPGIFAKPRGHNEWIMRGGGSLVFRHMQREADKYSYQGAQIPFIGFDELTHFSWGQFSYMLSRNRSVSGVSPVMRATCNPDPDHWLRGFLDWWIDEDGNPIVERSGVIRWMAVISGETFWEDTREELVARYGNEVEPLSVTFIPSLLDDNPALVTKDPGYRSKLKALPHHEREQLLAGNWNARPIAGNFFQRHWFNYPLAPPADASWVRYWDRAATEPSAANNDPDWTVGALVGKRPNGETVIADVVRFRGSPGKVRDAIQRVAAYDGPNVVVGLEREPGSSGKADTQHLAASLPNNTVKINPARRSKEAMWSPLSSQAEAGNVSIVQGSWNEALLAELEAVPLAGHDDQADAISGAYMLLSAPKRKPMMG